MKRLMVVLMLLVAVAAFGDAYNRGIDAYNNKDHATAEKLLTEYVEGGGTRSMAYICLGQIEKAKGNHPIAANYYEKAGELGKGKNRCSGYRCLIYSLTKVWSDAVIPRGDKAVKVLEAEYKDDGEAKIAIANWANRRGYALMKAKKNVDAMPWFEKAVAARGDFPLFANNLAVCYCELAEKNGDKVLAQKAVDVLSRWKGKPDPKLDATRERAIKLVNK